MIALAYVAGDTANPGVLDPGEVWTHEGIYTITAAKTFPAMAAAIPTSITPRPFRRMNCRRKKSLPRFPSTSTRRPPRLTAWFISTAMATDSSTATIPARGAGYIVEIVDASGDRGKHGLRQQRLLFHHGSSGDGYRIQFRRPNGAVLGTIDDLDLSPGITVADQDMPIDPSGIVYDARTRLPVPGVTVTMTELRACRCRRLAS